MAERAKARHNKLAKEPETASTDSLGSLTENFQKAANILISLVQLYYDDSEATFGDEKFEPLFSDDVLGRLRITTHRWGILIKTLRESIDLNHLDFPIHDFVKETLKTSKLNPRYFNFLTELWEHLSVKEKYCIRNFKGKLTV